MSAEKRFRKRVRHVDSVLRKLPARLEASARKSLRKSRRK